MITSRRLFRKSSYASKLLAIERDVLAGLTARAVGGVDAQHHLAGLGEVAALGVSANRITLWRDQDGVRVAPAGTTVAAISVDAMLVALDPTADLSAWLG